MAQYNFDDPTPIAGTLGQCGGPDPQLIESLGIAWRQKFNMLRSAVIGTVVGILPGAGGSVASLVSYAEARRASRTPENFGWTPPWLGARHGHVSYERILSGPGLVALYEFLRERGADPESPRAEVAPTTPECDRLVAVDVQAPT